MIGTKYSLVQSNINGSHLLQLSLNVLNTMNFKNVWEKKIPYEKNLQKDKITCNFCLFIICVFTNLF